ncbi:Arginine--tRNA ligase [bacterium HR23]|uniref:arginine--tRNA ligase n=1 Tax=uncultured prokaryote TaxID=198431 RepID=H5SLE4_9ZZZZ|nr:arginyl-tRNA synthetase [uncultured prokaryote]GBD11009.1 Arginine--tRNA ligase [bacterium HR23]
MLIQEQIAQVVRRALALAREQGLLPAGPLPDVVVERPPRPELGDFATNLPLRLARSLRLPPLEVAQRLASLLSPSEAVERVSVAPPGFINFTLRADWLCQQVDAILQAGATWGNLDIGRGQRIQVEFVSVNPTGPVHVGHTRGAVLGSTLANVLGAAGYQVVREYYINDAGSQIDAFARSLWARYLQALGRPASLPPDGYQGQYVVDMAQELRSQFGESLLALGEQEAQEKVKAWGVQRVLTMIREDLQRLGVEFDVWFSERSLYETSCYRKVMDILRQGGYLAEREGAVWFVSTALGEDKDNVLVRSSGLPTYFASDAAYHYHKFVVRGFDRVINIWGADHQGHVPRVKAMVQALGIDPQRLTIIIAQMVTLKRGGEMVRASKRKGELVTLRDLVDEVGPDACRYFFLARSADAQMEFDLDLAKKQSQENPVYYIQYAHARMAGILRQARERGVESDGGDVRLLREPAELALVRRLVLLPEVVQTVARTLEPHHLPHYALDLATAFHWFYDNHRVLTEDRALSKARLKLVEASRLVLARTLALMGMSAPERMEKG